MVNFAEHELHPSLVATESAMFPLIERARSRLSDITHYTSHSQWDDAKTALNGVGEIKRKLNDLWRKGSELNRKIRASMYPEAPAPEPVVDVEPEPEPEEDPYGPPDETPRES